MSSTFHITNDRFTKTGSGLTQDKRSIQDRFMFQYRAFNRQALALMGLTCGPGSPAARGPLRAKRWCICLAAAVRCVTSSTCSEECDVEENISRIASLESAPKSADRCEGADLRADLAVDLPSSCSSPEQVQADCRALRPRRLPGAANTRRPILAQVSRFEEPTIICQDRLGTNIREFRLN